MYIHIDINHIPNELKEKTEAYQYSKQNSSLSDQDPCNALEEEENPLDSYRFNSQETVFVPTFFSEEISIEPSEGNQPTWMLNDDYYEELAFQYLFPEKKFGYNPTRMLKLSPVKYFNNQHLLNFIRFWLYFLYIASGTAAEIEIVKLILHSKRFLLVQ